MCDVEIADGARDFRLMRREVVDAILFLSERQRFLQRYILLVGFRTKWLEHENTGASCRRDQVELLEAVPICRRWHCLIYHCAA